MTIVSCVFRAGDVKEIREKEDREEVEEEQEGEQEEDDVSGEVSSSDWQYNMQWAVMEQ